MWEKYQRKKENMSTSKNVSSKRASVKERQLFHGTSPEIVEAICKQNFDWRLHGKNATVYGEGSYFAVNSSYSDAYAKEDDLTSSKFMFVAQVLVGSYAVGDSSYRRPPQKDPTNPASDLYDSCVDDVSFPTIFVVFDTDQFYPEYIIEYSADSNTTQSGYYGGYQQPAATRSSAPKARLAQAAASKPRATRTYNSSSGYSNSSSVPYYSSGASSGPFSSTASATNVSYHNTTSATAYSSAYSSKPRTSNLQTRSSADSGTSSYSRSYSSGSGATNFPYYNTASASPYHGVSSPYSSSATSTYSSQRRSSNTPTSAQARQSGSNVKKEECLIL